MKYIANVLIKRLANDRMTASDAMNTFRVKNTIFVRKRSEKTASRIIFVECKV